MRDADRPSLLLTGFGPFPGVEKNVSARLVQRLAARARRNFPDYRVATAILPTEWDGGPARLVRHLARARPLLALHFGVSREAQGFVIETQGRNACRDSTDAKGHHPAKSQLDDNGPETRPARLPVTAIARRLADAAFPVAMSDDAGGYLCNAVLYRSLAEAEAGTGAALTGFVHIPASLEETSTPLSFAAAIDGGIEIIAACLDELTSGAMAPATTAPAPA
jgi:pyroglutamyl-peptidase